MSNGKARDAWRGGALPTNPVARRAAKSGGPKRRWLVAAIVLLGLGGIIAGLIIYLGRDPEPVILTLPIAAYADPAWPANPYVIGDARGVHERFGTNAETFPDQDKARILGALNQVADDSLTKAKGRPIVVMLSLLGFAENGVPYLLPGDAKPGNSNTWLKLDDILAPLRKANVPRILILDVRPVSSIRTVLSTSDVNEELDAALTKLEAANDLNFFVLNANTSSAGPVSLRPIKHTAFGLAVAQGLGGHADGWNPEKAKDQRVSVKELGAYVQETTQAAAAAFGYPPQVPKLYGSGTDFVIRLVPDVGAPPLPTLGDPEPLPDFLRESGEYYNALEKANRQMQAPYLMRQGRVARARAEAEWLAGGDVKMIQERFAPNEVIRKAEIAKRTPVPIPAKTIAQLSTDPDFAAKVAAVNTAFAPVFDKIRDPAGVKPEEFMGAQQAVKAKAAEHSTEAICTAAFNFVKSLEDPKFEQLRQVASTIASLRLPLPSRPDELKPAEWIAMEFVGGFPPEVVKVWPAGTLTNILLLIPTAGEAITGDGRNSPWLAASLTEADLVRRNGLVVLGNPESGKTEIREVVPDLGTVRDNYARIRDAGRALSRARKEYEATRAGIIDLGADFPRDLAANANDAASAYTALAESFLQMEQLLRPPETAKALPSVGDLDDTTGKLQTARTNLRGMIIAPTPVTVRAMEKALAWPGWSWPERLTLLSQYEAAARAGTTTVLLRWPTSPSGAAAAAPAKTSDIVASESLRDVLRMVREVRVFEPENVEPLETLVAKLGEKPSAADLATAAKQVQAARTKALLNCTKWDEIPEPMAWPIPSHFTGDAKAWRILKSESATEAAKSLEKLAR